MRQRLAFGQVFFFEAPKDSKRNTGTNTWSANEQDAHLGMEAACNEESRCRRMKGESFLTETQI